MRDLYSNEVASKSDRLQLWAVELINLEDGLRPIDTKRAPPIRQLGELPAGPEKDIRSSLETSDVV